MEDCLRRVFENGKSEGGVYKPWSHRSLPSNSVKRESISINVVWVAEERVCLARSETTNDRNPGLERRDLRNNSYNTELRENAKAKSYLSCFVGRSGWHRNCIASRGLYFENTLTTNRNLTSDVNDHTSYIQWLPIYREKKTWSRLTSRAFWRADEFTLSD